MSSHYSKIELKQPGFFQRLFGQQPEQNAFAEINNLLASKPVSEIMIQEVAAIAEKYGVDIYKKFSSQLRDLYAIYVRHCVKDHSFSAAEQEELRQLRAILLLNEHDVRELIDQVAGEIYRARTNEILSDGRLETEEDKTLEKIKAELLLSDEAAKKISAECRNVFVKGYLDRAISDRSLSDDEWKEFEAICKSLKAKVEFEDGTKELLDKFRLYWVIENGELPIQHIELHLHKNEFCYFTAPATWLENRTVTRSIRYGGPAVSIRIMKGVYYRTGQYDLQRITQDETREVDSGTIYVTGKRIIFTGSRRNTSIRLEKILSVNPYSDGVEIVKDSGKNPIFRITNNIDIFAMVLERVIRELK
jgi:hypothetical protein